MLAVQIEGDVISGSTLEAFRRLLLLVLLQDDRTLQDGPLQPSALQSIDELLLSHPPQTEKDMMLSTVVNLERMLNSGAAEIQGGCSTCQCAWLLPFGLNFCLISTPERHIAA
jgi:hypothetical protein